MLLNLLIPFVLTVGSGSKGRGLLEQMFPSPSSKLPQEKIRWFFFLQILVFLSPCSNAMFHNVHKTRAGTGCKRVGHLSASMCVLR